MGTVHGITDNFISNYNALKNENRDDEIVGSIRLAGSDQRLSADIDVIIVMKTLLTTGITHNNSLACACRKFFLSMLHAHNSYITRKRALEAISSPEGYEEDCLYKAITNCFGDVHG